MRRFLLLASLIVVSATSVSCRDSTGPTNSSIAGTNTLRTINGSPLPFVLSPSNPKIEFVSSQATLNENGTWTSTTTARVTNGTSVTTQTDTASGTYTLNGTALSFRDNSDGSMTLATLSGNSIILTDSDTGFSLVYTR